MLYIRQKLLCQVRIGGGGGRLTLKIKYLLSFLCHRLKYHKICELVDAPYIEFSHFYVHGSWSCFLGCEEANEINCGYIVFLHPHTSPASSSHVYVNESRGIFLGIKHNQM